jgi:hypothetical protein
VSGSTPGRTLPFALLVALLVAGAVAGWAVLELSDSTPIALVAAAAVAWGGVLVARRVRAGAGRRDSDELVSDDVEVSSGLRSYVARVIPLFAFCVGFGVIAGLLSAFGVDGPALAGIGPSEALAFVLAAPLWLDVDTRMSARAARKRSEEEGRLRAAADPGRAAGAAGGRGTTRAEWKARSHAARLELRREADGVAEIPSGGWRPWSLALGLLAGGVASATLVPLDDGAELLEKALGLLVGIGLVVLASLLLRRLVTAPYFLRLTPTGVDPMGAGEIPWEAVSSVDVSAAAGLKFLDLLLVPEVPRAEPWFTPRHHWMSNRLGDRGLSVTLLFSAAPAEVVVRAIRARSHVPVGVELDA